MQKKNCDRIHINKSVETRTRRRRNYKMKKRVIAAFLVAMMGMSTLAGCGGADT